MPTVEGRSPADPVLRSIAVGIGLTPVERLAFGTDPVRLVDTDPPFAAWMAVVEERRGWRVDWCRNPRGAP